MELRMNNFNFMGVQWKIRFLRGVTQKKQYIGGNCLKRAGLDSLQRAVCEKEGNGVFEGGVITKFGLCSLEISLMVLPNFLALNPCRICCSLIWTLNHERCWKRLFFFWCSGGGRGGGSEGRVQWQKMGFLMTLLEVELQKKNYNIDGCPLCHWRCLTNFRASKKKTIT